jgi:hypothetical protein
MRGRQPELGPALIKLFVYDINRRDHTPDKDILPIKRQYCLRCSMLHTQLIFSLIVTALF